jgi:hypothetical protein
VQEAAYFDSPSVPIAPHTLRISWIELVGFSQTHLLQQSVAIINIALAWRMNTLNILPKKSGGILTFFFHLVLATRFNLLVRCRMGFCLQKMGWCSSLLKFEDLNQIMFATDSTIMSIQRLKYNISAT